MKPITPKRRKLDEITFRESLAPAMPLAPTPELLTPYQLRTMVVILWALGSIAVGAYVGYLITPRPIAQFTPQPAPIDATITQATPVTGDIGTSTPSSLSLGTTTTPSAITQAQSGTPIQTVSYNYLQPSATPLTYTPGYFTFNAVQGTVGTSSVE